MYKVLTIAGSDSGGGAGIQADLKSFAARGVYGMTAITALTAQNTRGVQGVFDVPGDFIRAQIDSVMSDIGADAWKTGMLSNADTIAVVAERAAHYQVSRLVVDFHEGERPVSEEEPADGAPSAPVAVSDNEGGAA